MVNILLELEKRIAEDFIIFNKNLKQNLQTWNKITDNKLLEIEYTNSCCYKERSYKSLKELIKKIEFCYQYNTVSGRRLKLKKIFLTHSDNEYDEKNKIETEEETFNLNEIDSNMPLFELNFNKNNLLYEIALHTDFYKLGKLISLYIYKNIQNKKNFSIHSNIKENNQTYNNLLQFEYTKDEKTEIFKKHDCRYIKNWFNVKSYEKIYLELGVMNERFGWSCEKYNYDNNNMISKISQKYLTGILYGLLSKIREDINLSQTQGNINFYKIFYDNLNCLYDSFNIKNKKNKTIN